MLLTLIGRRAPQTLDPATLADILVELEVTETVSYETVRQALEQTFSSRG